MTKLQEGLQVIKHNRSQTDIVLREEANAAVYLSPEVMEDLVHALKPPHVPITCLVLCGYRLPAQSVQILASFLASASALVTLDMSFCLLTTEDVGVIVDAVMECECDCRPLRLNFGYNKLDTNAGKVLAAAMSKRPGRVSHLSVRSNDLQVTGVVPLLRNDVGLSTLDVAFTHMASPYDTVFKALHTNTTLVHLKLCGASFSDEERTNLDRATLHNAKSQLKERSQVVTLDPRTNLVDVTNKRTPQSPCVSLPPPVCSSPVSIISTPVAGATKEIAQPLGSPVSSLREEMKEIREANQVYEQENRQLRSEVREIRELLLNVLRSNQEALAAAQQRPSTAPSTARASGGSIRSVTPPMTQRAAMSQRNYAPSEAPSRCGREPVRARSPGFRSPSARSASVSHRNPTPTIPIRTVSQSTVPARGVPRRPSVSTAATVKQPPAKPSTRLTGTMQIRPATNAHHQVRLHLQPFAGIA